MLAFLPLMATLLPAQAPEAAGWKRMPSLPDPFGFAGMAAGSPGDLLMAAGGARFPEKPPWEGGTKQYADSIWLLANIESGWSRSFQKLPSPVAYAVSATWKDSVIVAGGETRADSNSPINCISRVFTIRIVNNTVRFSDLPALPTPIAYAAGAIMNSRLLVLGGINSPSATKALGDFWVLDLANPAKGWEKGPSFPGTARMLPVFGTTETGFFVMGGAELFPDSRGKPARRYLRDAWRLDADGRWHQLPDMPRPVAAAASPAPVSMNRIWILSGDDGSQTGASPVAHKGFASSSFALDCQENRWIDGPPVPAPRVTLPVASFRNRWWLISGESRPGIRSPEVWSAEASSWALR